LLPLGNVERQLIISTDDPAYSSKLVRVQVQVNGLVDASAPNELRLTPTEINYGRTTAASLMQDTTDVLLHFPSVRAVGLGDMTVTQIADSDDYEIDFVDSHADSTGELEYHFSIHWVHEPKQGNSSHRVVFDVRDSHNRRISQLRLPLIGEMLDPLPNAAER
jgi:hypothetical protein